MNLHCLFRHKSTEPTLYLNRLMKTRKYIISIHVLSKKVLKCVMGSFLCIQSYTFCFLCIGIKIKFYICLLIEFLKSLSESITMVFYFLVQSFPSIVLPWNIRSFFNFVLVISNFSEREKISIYREDCIYPNEKCFFPHYISIQSELGKL